MATLITNLLKNEALKFGLNYLIKGGLVTAASTTFLGQIRKSVQSSFRFALLQVLFFGALLFLIDYIVPRFLPKLKGTSSENLSLGGILGRLLGGKGTTEEGKS